MKSSSGLLLDQNQNLYLYACLSLKLTFVAHLQKFRLQTSHRKYRPFGFSFHSNACTGVQSSLLHRYIYALGCGVQFKRGIRNSKAMRNDAQKFAWQGRYKMESKQNGRGFSWEVSFFQFTNSLFYCNQP